MKKTISYFLLFSLTLYSSTGYSASKEKLVKRIEFNTEKIFPVSKEALYNASLNVMKKKGFEVYECSLDSGIIAGDMQRNNFKIDKINENADANGSVSCLDILGFVLLIGLFVYLFSNNSDSDYEEEEYYEEDVYASNSRELMNYYLLDLTLFIDSLDLNHSVCTIDLWRYYIENENITDKSNVHNEQFNLDLFNDIEKELQKEVRHRNQEF